VDALFSDPYAATLAGDEGRQVLEASERASGGENGWLPIRGRFLDDVITGEVGPGDQVVLLGAGLDARAFRLPLPADIDWFEVDHATVLDSKERTLRAAGARCAAASWHPVAADLVGGWSDTLGAAGFLPGRRTIWVAEGVFFYLPAAAVATLLDTAARLSGPRSLLVADVSGSGILRLPSMGAFLAARTAAGRPPPFTSDDPDGLLRGCGWPQVEILEPRHLAGRYRRTIRAHEAIPTDDPTMRTYVLVARLPP
jgi:methyltransferase (TIGR00027 family)